MLVADVPPGPVTVTVAEPLPVDGAVYVNGVPLVGDEVLIVPAPVTVAESVPLPPVRVAVMLCVAPSLTLADVGDTDRAYAVYVTLAGDDKPAADTETV